MSDNKKYYYMRLKDGFFESDQLLLLEGKKDGVLYSNILLKLYLKSLKHDGRLMFTERIPYNAEMIATITRHQVGTVEKALQIFYELGLIEILDNGAIYMLDIQNFIGKSSSEADRVRKYRQKIDNERKLLHDKSCTNVMTNVQNEENEQMPETVEIPAFVQMYDECTPEREKELDIDIDIETELDTELEYTIPGVSEKHITKRLCETYGFGQQLSNSLINWIAYRCEDGAVFKERQLDTLCSTISGYAFKVGEEAVANLIGLCVASGWKTIVFERLKDVPLTEEAEIAYITGRLGG